MGESAAGGVDCCGTHSSLRSSSHGWDMLPNMRAGAVSRRCGGRREVCYGRRAAAGALWHSRRVRGRHATEEAPIAGGDRVGA